MKMLSYDKHDLMKSNGLYVFFNSFGDVCPLCKYDLLEEENPSYLMHNLWYMDVIFYVLFIYYCSTLGIFDTKYTICRNFAIKKKVKKYMVFWNIK
jgi:hypothetical protein